jgi:hypothetical protein
MNSKIPTTFRAVSAALFTLAIAYKAPAQNVENAMHTTIGYITAEGQVENSSHTTMGYYTTNGSGWIIESSNRSFVGYINAWEKGEYSVESDSHATMGYVKRGGDTWTVKDKTRNIIGYIDKDGKVEDGSRRTMGYARDIQPLWMAVYFFFITLQ